MSDNTITITHVNTLGGIRKELDEERTLTAREFASGYYDTYRDMFDMLESAGLICRDAATMVKSMESSIKLCYDIEGVHKGFSEEVIEVIKELSEKSVHGIYKYGFTEKIVLQATSVLYHVFLQNPDKILTLSELRNIIVENEHSHPFNILYNRDPFATDGNLIYLAGRLANDGHIILVDIDPYQYKLNKEKTNE